MITFSRLGRSGRLGNQLWQIASTAGIAQQMSQSLALPKWDYRPYFRVPDEFFDRDVTDMTRPWIQSPQTRYVQHMDPRARDYLQDLALWKTIEPQVRDWFQPSEIAMETLRRCTFDVDGEQVNLTDLPRPSLSLHIRRGDNANAPNNCHPLRPWSYYESAIEKLDGQFEAILVFSDDIEWCRTALRDYMGKYEIAFFVGTPRAKEHEPEYRTGPVLDWIDLQLMSFCDLHVISNSTYSWWGAFLSHDESPIYPWPFFGSDLDYIDCGLMFPDSWQRIDHGQQYV